MLRYYQLNVWYVFELNLECDMFFYLLLYKGYFYFYVLYVEKDVL